MDLAKLDLEAAASSGISVNLRHPVTDEELEHGGKPITIVILGRDSNQWNAEQKKINTRNSKKYKKGTIPIPVVEKSLKEILARCTIEVPNNNLIFEGKKVKCEFDALFQLYQDRPWITEQLAQAAADRSELFLG